MGTMNTTTGKRGLSPWKCRPIRMMGILPETVRNHSLAKRTSHPILSFAGIGADNFLEMQTLQEPFAPIGVLAEEDGWVVLINVDHTVNTSIHCAERLARRRTFLRWALLKTGWWNALISPATRPVSNAIAKYIQPYTRRVDLEEAFIQAVPLKKLFEVVQDINKKRSAGIALPPD